MGDDMSALLAAMPFAAACGVEFATVTKDEVVATLAWAPERCTTAGVLHGGALMTLADTAGAVCAFLNLPPGATTSTIESKTNFFRAVRGGSVRATTRPLHAGPFNPSLLNGEEMEDFLVLQQDFEADGGLTPVAEHEVLDLRRRAVAALAAVLEDLQLGRPTPEMLDPPDVVRRVFPAYTA
jgi:uncharacterized protein (TIGR00369 family)